MNRYHFSASQWLQALEDLPDSSQSTPPIPEHSSYLQEHVFDILKQGEPVDLSRLDWEQISLTNTVLKSSRSDHLWIQSSWIKALQNKLTKAAPTASQKRQFF